MNLNDAFSAGLVIYTRRLLRKCRPPLPEMPAVSRVVFHMLPRGVFRPKAQTLTGVDAWADYVRKYGLRDIRLHVPTDGSMNHLGFVNYRDNSVVCRWKNVSTQLELQWDFDESTSLWTVTLTERPDGEAVTPVMQFSRATYTDLLTELADFSAFLEEPFFEEQFRKAAACLTDPQAPAPAGEPASTLPWPFSGVWNAASYASLIGGMGSWNDVPQGKAAANMSGIRYQRLTNELMRQNRLAVCFAANEFMNPEAVSCEFPPKRQLTHGTPGETE